MEKINNKPAFDKLADWVQSGQINRTTIELDGFENGKIVNGKPQHDEPRFNFKTVRYVGSMAYPRYHETKRELLDFLEYIIDNNMRRVVRWKQPEDHDDEGWMYSGKYTRIEIGCNNADGEAMFVRIIYDPRYRKPFVCAFHPSTYTDYEKGQPSWWH